MRTSTRQPSSVTDRRDTPFFNGLLAVLNNRYGDLERRIFELVARTGAGVFVVGAGGDLLLANASRDGLINVMPSHAYGLDVTLANGQKFNFPMSFVCEITSAGFKFIRQYADGVALS